MQRIPRRGQHRGLDRPCNCHWAPGHSSCSCGRSRCPHYPAKVTASLLLTQPSTHPSPFPTFLFLLTPSHCPALGPAPTTTKHDLLSCHRSSHTRLALGPADASGCVFGRLQGWQVDASRHIPGPPLAGWSKAVWLLRKSLGGVLPSGHGGSMREIWSVLYMYRWRGK
jgi:hypothetical protein